MIQLGIKYEIGGENMKKEPTMVFEEVNGKKYPYWYGIDMELAFGGKVTAFYGYTSSVRERILEVGFSHNDSFDHLRENLVVEAQIVGINARVDNKVVFEVTSNGGRKLYLGWYDGRFTVGLDVYTESPANEQRRK
jgi:hypothetical protein